MIVTEQPSEVLHPEPTDEAPLPAPVNDATAEASAAIVQAADAAMAMPGVVGRDEFLVLAMQARILSMSGAAPKLVRNNPYVTFHVAMVGRDLGISATAALELIDVMDTQGGPRLSLSPQLLNGQIRRLGLGSIVPAVQSTDRCVAVVLGPGGHLDPRCGVSWPEHADGCECRHLIGSTEFTWEDARMAGLAGAECQPGAHSTKCMNKDSAAQWKCQQGYKTYPRRMMWWRAAGFAADDWFPEAGLGLYTAEELGAVVDENGRPIDPAAVALPEGYEPEPAKAPEPEQMADEAVVAELRHLIAALPDEARALLADEWKAQNEAGTPYLRPLKELPRRQTAKAKAKVQQYVARAKAGEWGDWEPPAPLPAEGPTAPQEPTAPVAASDPAPEPEIDPQRAEDADTDAARRELDLLLDGPPADEPPAPTLNPELEAELEKIAQQYEALTPYQQEWLAAAIAKEGLRFDQLEGSAPARMTMRALLAGAAAQPAEAPDTLL